MWMNALWTMEDAVNSLPAPTYLAASNVPVIMDSSAMDLPAQVRHSFRQLFTVLYLLHTFYFKLISSTLTSLLYRSLAGSCNCQLFNRVWNIISFTSVRLSKKSWPVVEIVHTIVEHYQMDDYFAAFSSMLGQSIIKRSGVSCNMLSNAALRSSGISTDVEFLIEFYSKSTTECSARLLLSPEQFMKL